MNNFKSNLSKRLNVLLIVFVFILKLSSVFSQGPCDCAALNSTNLCNGGYFADHAAAAAATPNPYTPASPLAWTSGSYTFCTKYTAPANVSKIGFMNFITAGTSSGSNCSFTRGSWTAYANGCSTPITGTAVAGDANSYEFPVTPGIEYRFCVTVTLTGPCQDITGIENYLYTAATSTPPSVCSSTIGTFSMQKNSSATANASSYDLLPGETFTITSNNNATLPPVGVDGDQSGVGYAAFRCDPSGYDLGDPAKYNTTDMPCYLGLHYSPSMTDQNGINSQVAGVTPSLTSWWLVPLTFDDVCSSSTSISTSPCPSGNPTSIGIDTDGDGCMAYSSPIQINYVIPNCGSCVSANCPIGNVPTYADRFPPTGAQICVTGITASGTYKTYQSVTSDILGTLGAYVQNINQTSTSTTTITQQLFAVSDCGGTNINAFDNNVANRSQATGAWNPEWYNLIPNTNYILVTTFVITGTMTEYCMDYYYIPNPPVITCPSDLTFIELDWAQGNPFVPFPSTTYTCTSGPQTIWKNVETTISTGGEIQAFPGFFMELTTNANSDNKTSALVTVNGTPYSYYGPTGTAPAGVLDWGPMAVPPQYQNIIEPYLPAGATITITLKDLRAGTQSFPYTIYDHSTGAILASGTAAPNSTTPIIITFTLSSPTMTWRLDGGTANITDNNNGSATFNPSNLTAGNHTITYTWTNNAGCNITANQTITVGPKPTLVITDPPAVCIPSTVDITAASVTTGSTAGSTFTYFINPAGTSSLPTPAAITNSGTYYIKSTVGTCITIQPVTVLINNCACPYTIAITTPAAVCSPNTVDITAPAVTAGSVGGGTLTYWSDQACTIPITNLAAAAIATTGTYYIKGDNGVCTDTKPVVVTVNTTPVLVITDPQAVCSPNTVNITLASITAGSSGGGILTYWNDATATNSSNATPTAIATSNTYYIKATNGDCIDKKPVIVTINTLPITPTASSANYCQNDVTSPLTTTATAGSVLNWYQNPTGGASSATTPSITSTTVGTSNYYVTQTDANGCESALPRTQISITIKPIPVVAVNSPTICKGEGITLTATGATTYSWDSATTNGISTSNPYINTPLNSTTFRVTGTTNGCFSIAIATVTVNPIPTLVFVDTLAICSPETVDLTTADRTIGSTPSSTFEYYINSSGTSNLTGVSTIDTGGKYFIQAELNGCKSKMDSVIVIIQQKPAVFFTPSPATVTTSNPIAKMINGTIGAENYFWNFGDSGTATEISPEHSFPNTDTATYIITLVAVSKEGCIDSLKKSVKVIEDLIFYVPNSFTPDGDQYNQEFKPIFTSGFDQKGYELLIFDRWGNIVFQTTDYTKGWDGRRLGAKEKVQDGAYTWKIFYSIKSDDRREFLVGHVNVIR
jgi:gliding motility-associated-like protein